MHFDTVGRLIAAGFMFKMPEVEVGAEFAVDSNQKVHVERSRNAEFIVVCGNQLRWWLVEVGPEQKAIAGLKNSADLSEEL